MRKTIAWILLIVFAVMIAATMYGTLFAGHSSNSPSIPPFAAGAVQEPWYTVLSNSPCSGATTIYLSNPPKCMTADGLRVMEPQGPFIVPIGKP